MRLDSHPQPLTDYAAALERVAALQAQDGERVNALCRTTLLTHGARAGRALVLLHGFTNCPRQFHRLAQQCFERQFNVLSPRLPYHGLSDRLSDDLARMDARELATFTDALLDLAHGLGERVCVAGISLGANLALWAAQQRGDIDRAVAIAPVLLPRHVPAWSAPWLWRLLRRLPNRFIWWDRAYKESLPGPAHAYPRFPTHALAAVFAFAQDVQQRAFGQNMLPRAGSIALLTNASDPAVDNRATQALVARWRANGASHLSTYEFHASLHLIHDCVDPDQVEQQVETVYPVLMDAIVSSGVP